MAATLHDAATMRALVVDRPLVVPFALALALAGCGNVKTAPDASLTPDASIDGAPADAVPSSIALALEHAAITAPRSIGVEIDVTLTRIGVDGEVVITVLGPLPTGITASALVLAPGATTGTLVLEIDETANSAATDLVVEARAADGTAVATAPVTLTIDQTTPAFDASWVEHGAAKLERELWTVPGWTSPPLSFLKSRGDYTGAVTSRWSGLPTGVTAMPQVTMVGSATMTFVPTPASTVRTELVADTTTVAPQTVQATLIASDGTYRQTLRATLTIGKAPALDPAVGTAGRLTEAWGGLRAVAADLDASGRLIATYEHSSGGARYVRYTSDGAVDLTWGPSNLTSPFTSTHMPVDGLVGAGDTVVTVGNLNERVVITRMTADGVADPTLDGDGVLTVPSTRNERAAAIRIRGGKFVIAGTYDDVATITRVNGDGTLDTTFSGDGRARLPDASAFYRLMFDSQNRIIAIGETVTESGVIARFLPTGELDGTFGNTGAVIVDMSSYGTALDAIAEAANGDLVVAANVRAVGPTTSGALLRFTANGTPVTTFGSNGVVPVSLSTDGLEHVSLYNVRCTPAAITAYGTRGEINGTWNRPLIARFDDAGAAVTTFGTNGFEWILGGDLGEQLRAMRATPAGIWLFASTESTRVLMRSLVGL